MDAKHFELSNLSDCPLTVEQILDYTKTEEYRDNAFSRPPMQASALLEYYLRHGSVSHLVYHHEYGWFLLYMKIGEELTVRAWWRTV